MNDFSEFDRELKFFIPNSSSFSTNQNAWVVQLPGSTQLEISRNSPNLDWDLSSETDVASTRLWLRSLYYLPDIFLSSGKAATGKLLESYCTYITAKMEDHWFLKTNSLDHQLALNLLVLCKIRLLCDRHNKTNELAQYFNESEQRNFAYQLEKWLRQPGFMLQNNHGMFILNALLASRLVFSEVDRTVNLSDDISWLINTLEECFDETGLTIENTPGYQQLWIGLLRQSAYLLEKNNADGNSLKIVKEAVHRIEQTFRHLILPERLIPPLGDSRKAPEPEYFPLPGTVWSPQCGFFSSSSEDALFSFKCGSRSPVHKQLDDTSIYLHVKGIDVLCDAGLLSYDSFDKKSVLTRGQLGHSGLFFPCFDAIPQAALYPIHGASRITAGLTRDLSIDGQTQLLKASYSIDDKFVAEREIEFYNERKFIVVDHCKSIFTQTAVQRFRVSNKAQIHCTRGNLILTFETFEVSIRFESPISLKDLDVFRDEIGDNQIRIDRSIPTDGQMRSFSVEFTDLDTL
ncbi:hypothetical protein JOD55_000437 [Arcanobacterium pluranimalium]|uniref:heparinase II/III domain-containing protein n=1 Tax=Arcanobacterium pluranimalium TaxID=108028 RepID=UPI00195C3A35|nr:heparinase II/III family protein [Arcanobacterium pluranimalium]MBM7824610.1 hypothetical protein [Arcanobacterium pluranimalium]